MPRLPLIFGLFSILISIMAFLLTDVALDLAQVLDLVFILIFFYHYVSIDSKSLIASSTLSIILIFLRGRSLRFTISKRGVIRLSFVLVLISVFLIGFVLVFLD